MKNISKLQILAGAITLAVLSVIIGGLYLAGNPAIERGRRIDTERVNSLDQIHYAINQYYDTHGNLPESLPKLIASPANNYINITDPESGSQYEYKVTSAKIYELCAVFATDASTTDFKNDYRYAPPKPVTIDGSITSDGFVSWNHGIGRTCFSLNVLRTRAYQPCGALGPECGSKFTCAKIESYSSPICVPADKMCEIAGCANDKCLVAESYPPMVRCTTK